MSTNPQASRPEGLIGSIRGLLGNLLGTLQVRLEILSLDITEERFNLARMLIVALSVLFCFQAGVFLAVLFVVLSVADADRLAAIGVAALVLLLMAIVGAVWLWRWLKTRPPLFAGTIAELQKDRDRLGGKK